jgi:hypothetical protein
MILLILLLNLPANAFHPLPGTSDAKLVQEIMEAYKDEHYEYIIWDPRGSSAKGNTPMSTSFCPHCRCPPLKCHAQLFGCYCQLHVVNALYQRDEPMKLIQARELYRDRYNIALQIKIVEETGQLDIKWNEYKLPKCVEEQSLKEPMDYVEWYKYHVNMHNGIVVGHGKAHKVHDMTNSHEEM